MTDGRATSNRAATWESEDLDALCDRCGTDDWRVFSGPWAGWAECSWCGHRQSLGTAPAESDTGSAGVQGDDR